MSSEIEREKQKLNETSQAIDNRRKLLGKIMIVFCVIGVLLAIVAFILLIVGVISDNKVCEVIGIVLNFLDISTLGISLIKTMIKFNGYLKK